MDKLESLIDTRKDIARDYSGKEILSFPIDKIASHSEVQHVLVKEIIEETKDTKSYILVPDIEKGTKSLMPFLAGQYISLQLHINDTYQTRAYSLSSSPREAINGFYRITVKRVENGIVSNYIHDDIKVGDHLTISKPMGDFIYQPIIDEENVIAIAGGVGITPFVSMAKSILDKEIDCHLTVLYSVKTSDDIILKDDILKLNQKSKKVKFVITLTREENEHYLYGRINQELVEQYLKEFNTIFMCGPKELYKSMNEIFMACNVPRKSVHYENYYHEYHIEQQQNYQLKVLSKDEVIETTCKSNETLLEAMEKANIEAPSMCRVGTCGYCRSILVEGKIKMIGALLPRSLSENDYIHPCVTYPESDIVLRLDI